MTTGIALRADRPIGYDAAWDWFRKTAAPQLVADLRLESWLFGTSVLDRRGHDVLFCNMDGFETAEWTITTFLGHEDNLTDCCRFIHQIDERLKELLTNR